MVSQSVSIKAIEIQMVFESFFGIQFFFGYKMIFM